MIHIKEMDNGWLVTYFGFDPEKMRVLERSRAFTYSSNSIISKQKTINSITDFIEERLRYSVGPVLQNEKRGLNEKV